jgi:hypothetical protein
MHLNPISVVTNPNNPDDTVGLRHNRGLDAIMPYYNNGNLQPTQQNVFYYTKNYLVNVGYDTSFINSTYNYTIEHGLYSFPAMPSIDTVALILYNNGNISSEVKNYINTLSNLINSLDENAEPTQSMYDGFANQAISYENQIVYDNSLEDAEKAMLLSAYSVARYSLAYWCNYYNGSSQPLVMNKTNSSAVSPQYTSDHHWFHWKSVGKEDVCGALAGAAGGAIVGAFAGGVGAGPGAVVGGVGGAVTGSVQNAAEQLWDHFFGES